MYKLRVILISMLMSFVGAASANHKSEKSIQERTAPSGKVYRAGDDVPVAKPMVVEASGPMSGKDVYDQKCAMCHGAGIAGAPKAGDAAVWADRVAKGEAALFSSAINGVPDTGMMAKGGCAGCSDEEITEAVKHMLSML